MSISKTKALILTVAMAATMASAQNARVEALGGAPVSDISDVTAGYAALMTQYTNQAHATVYPGLGYGNVIGIYALNDMLSLGVSANFLPITENIRDDYLTEGGGNMTFFETARGNWAFMEFITDVPFPFQAMYSNVPRLMVGADLGTVQVGAELYLEWVRSSHSEEYEMSGAVNDIENETVNARIMHPGLRLSAAVELGDIGILVKVGMGLPMFNYTYTYEEVGYEVEVEVKSDGAIYMEFGGEVTAPLLGADVTVGGEYAFSSHKTQMIVSETGEPEVKFTENVPNRNSALEAYVGAWFNVLNGTAAVGYNFRREASVWDVDTSGVSGGITLNDDSRFVDLWNIHTISAGLENVWEDAWFFDNVALRTGAYYVIRNNRVKIDAEVVQTSTGSSLTETYEYRHKYGTEYSAVVPTLGFGLTKNYFTLDVSLELGDWTGLFNGPGVSSVTASIRF